MLPGFVPLSCNGKVSSFIPKGVPQFRNGNSRACLRWTLVVFLMYDESFFKSPLTFLIDRIHTLKSLFPTGRIERPLSDKSNLISSSNSLPISARTNSISEPPVNSSSIRPLTRQTQTVHSSRSNPSESIHVDNIIHQENIIDPLYATPLCVDQDSILPHSRQELL